MRRKELGGTNPSCFDCGESDIACLELDHPLGQKRDLKFTRTRCRNCHRKVEFKRDVAGLTKNGQHRTDESEIGGMCNYLLLMAEDQDLIAERLDSPPASPALVAAALRASAASLRRKAKSLASAHPLDAGTSQAGVPDTRSPS